jgi:hypothetical protein
MKLQENELLMNAGEGLSLDEICDLGCKAHFEGRVDEGMALFEQLKPSDGDVFIRANCFLSQVLCFSRNFDMALACISGLLKPFPRNVKVLDHAVLVHSYRGEYEQSGQLLGAYQPEPFDKAGYYYQAGCILAGLKDYESSLLSLSISLEAGGGCFGSKLWYDPEMSLLWKALPSIAESPEVREILSKAYWPELVASYDPEAPFDELDPGNLRSFSSEEMHFVGVVPRGPMAYLIEKRRPDNPRIYDALLNCLKDQRERSVQGLKEALSKIA